MVAAIELATGRRALGLGKPSPITMCDAASELGTEAKNTVVIGDTMETDILGGVQLGFSTVLVLTGGTKRADLSEYAYRPTHVVNSIVELISHEILQAPQAEAS